MYTKSLSLHGPRTIYIQYIQATAFNEESVIERTIRSVLVDTGPEVEVVVIANGCQDLRTVQSLVSEPGKLKLAFFSESSVGSFGIWDFP